MSQETPLSQEAWRVIITVSSDGEDTSVWNAVNDELTNALFSRRGRTATWDREGLSAVAAPKVLSQVLHLMAGRHVLDHVWIYIERHRELGQ